MDYSNNETYPDYFEATMYEKVLQNVEKFCIIPLGTIGNILIIIIMTQTKNRNHASSVIFTSLAVSDIAILWIGWFNSIELSTTVGCKIGNFIGYTVVQLSSLLLATVAVERAFCVKMPHNVKTIFSVANTKKMVVSIVIVLILINSCTVISFEAVTIDGILSCMPRGELEYFMYAIHPWLDLTLSFLITFVVSVTSSVLIISQLRTRSRIVGTSKNDRSHSVTMALLGANFTFLITMCPFVIAQIVNPYPSYGTRDYHLWTTLLNLSQSNAAANFYVYVLSGPKFRADLKEFFVTYYSRFCMICRGRVA
ncbi:hypothetical protein ACF0H5_002633 [Mactra antiquata]